MFEVGFFEIIVICVVALIVLGPDKLPGTIRVMGLWIGRLKRSFNNIKTEIEKEVGADEIRRQLRNEEIMEKIKKTKSDFNNTVESVKKEATSVTDSMKPDGLDDLKKDFDSITGKSKGASSDNADKAGQTSNADSEKEDNSPQAASAPENSDQSATQAETPAPKKENSSDKSAS
jgi:sec-independent protein translocase protein TatB